MKALLLVLMLALPACEYTIEDVARACEATCDAVHLPIREFTGNGRCTCGQPITCKLPEAP